MSTLRLTWHQLPRAGDINSNQTLLQYCLYQQCAFPLLISRCLWSAYARQENYQFAFESIDLAFDTRPFVPDAVWSTSLLL